MAGVADAVRAAASRSSVPGARRALEGSKAFAKHLMEATEVPQDERCAPHSRGRGRGRIRRLGAPIVKADGLAAGKGVTVASDRAAALADADGRSPDGTVLIEEFLDGPESRAPSSGRRRMLPMAPPRTTSACFDTTRVPTPAAWASTAPPCSTALPHRAYWSISSRATRRDGLRLMPRARVHRTPVRRTHPHRRGNQVSSSTLASAIPRPRSCFLARRPAVGTAAGCGIRSSGGSSPPGVRPPTLAVTVVLASEGYPAAPVTSRPLTGLREAEAVPPR